MIAQLKGLLDFKGDDYVILDINGVGYLVYVNAYIIEHCMLHEVVTLKIQTIVKEDSINLYGFLNFVEKQCFNLLLSVQGVGAKMALSILGNITVKDIINNVLSNNIELFKQISGIGNKVAQRLVNELKDKVIKLNSLELNYDESPNSANMLTKRLNVVKALEGLGYSKIEIENLIKNSKVTMIDDISIENILKDILKYAANNLS